MTFDPGDIVQLKSGGPPMTVVRRDSDAIHCVYFGELSDEALKADFPAVCLEILDLESLVHEPPPPPPRDRPRLNHR